MSKQNYKFLHCQSYRETKNSPINLSNIRRIYFSNIGERFLNIDIIFQYWKKI